MPLRTLISIASFAFTTLASAQTTQTLPYTPVDATATIQAALDGDASTIIIPSAPGPWITAPLTLSRDGVTLILEPGAELLAKLGAYPELYDSTLLTVRAANTKIIGSGATIRMRNGEDPDYNTGEWRHAIGLIAAQNIEITGLTITLAGGDGILVNGNWLADENHIPSRDVLIQDCTFDDNRRQGISVISVEGLTVQRCTFTNIGATNGTDPMSGIDFEPDEPYESLVNCVVQDCTFINNRGSLYATGLQTYMGNLGPQAPPVDILVQRCTFTSTASDGAAVYLVSPNDQGPPSTTIIRDCTIDNIRGVGILAVTSAATSSTIIERVTLRNTHTDEAPWGGAPIYLDGQQANIAQYGNIQFIDCTIFDTKPRPFIKAYEGRAGMGLPDTNAVNITGNITVINPNPEGWIFDLEANNDKGINLTVTACAPQPTDLDGSGATDLADLNTVLAAFGNSAAGDTNNDGVTDLQDLNAVLASFGTACP